MILRTSNLPDQKICLLPKLWSMAEPEEEKRQSVWKQSCVGPGKEEERSSTLPLCRTGASEGTKHAIRATIHCEVVITRANECAIAPRIKVHANERLFIIGEHNSSHNPISCPAIRRGDAWFRQERVSQQGFGEEALLEIKKRWCTNLSTQNTNTDRQTVGRKCP